MQKTVRHTVPLIACYVLDRWVNLTRSQSHTESWHKKVRVQKLKTLRGLSHPTWLLVFMLLTANLIRDFCLPSRSTWVVAVLRGLNQQPYTSSSKPDELGHDERVPTKKSRVTGEERGILLVAISCCVPPSVALW